LGIDVSSNNGTVDWTAVAGAGMAFGFVKASEGVGYVNPNFRRDWAAIKAAGMVRGAYHFARPDLGNTPQAEAMWFWSVIPDFGPGDIVILDIEQGNGDLSGWVQAFMATLMARAAVRPVLYSYGPFIRDHNLYGDWPLWLAAYQQDEPAVPGGFDSIAIWQCTDAATVPGVQGTVDQSRCYVDLASLGRAA
jgi:GH25 family lysozyme M1 (1,4-beta-N-acetylmuramidase)